MEIVSGTIFSGMNFLPGVAAFRCHPGLPGRRRHGRQRTV